MTELATGQAIAAAALGWVGTPVHWEASLKGVGADCRGVLAGVARECGRPEGHEIEARLVGYSRAIDEGALLAGLDRLFTRREGTGTIDTGDVLAFRIRRKIQHLGIYVGGGRFVHAYMGGPRVVVSTPLGTFWGSPSRLAGVWAWRDLGAG